MYDAPISDVWNNPAAFREKMASPHEPVSVKEFEGSDSPQILPRVAYRLNLSAAELEDSDLLSTDVRVLRAQLMVEELAEVIDAMIDGDVVKLVDGLADLLYVVGGTIDAFNLKSAMAEIFTDVHRANMEKRNADGSARVRDKGEGWVPPRIKEILIKHGVECN